MDSSSHISSLIDDLTSANKETLERAAIDAQILLQVANLSPDDSSSSVNSLRDILSPEYSTIVLSESDMDVIAGRLIKLLDGPPEIVGLSAAGLRYSGRPYSIPKLSETLIKYMLLDNLIAQQLIYALDELVLVLVTIGGRRPLTPEEDGYIRDACTVLHQAAEIAVGSTTGVGRTAGDHLRIMRDRVESIGRSC